MSGAGIVTVPPPIERPDLIVPDTGPLIHLAQADALHLLHQIGGRVVVADMVALEATQDLSKPGAHAVERWQRIVATAPTANPDIAVMMQRRPGSDRG